MQPRISMITLGVRDLERAQRFYRDGLGWPVHGDHEDVVLQGPRRPPLGGRPQSLHLDRPA